VPALVLTGIAAGVHRRAYEVHQALLGLAIALSSTSLLIHVFKNFIGRPRPDFLDRCQPPSGATDPFMALSTISVCTQTDAKILADGMKSFPSGHSACKLLLLLVVVSF
jgi:diacylglycerol diphosphate phosphatase/phosphatidate phosphatase